MIYPWLLEDLRSLCSRAEAKSLHHGMLIKGIPGIGKTEFATHLANFLLCSNPYAGDPCGECQGCHLFKATSHPDFHQVMTEKQVGVDLIRDAITKLQGTAQLSGNKVLVIHGAETMTESAANALLKTLEEPTRNTYIILLCDSLQGILPTILSRCEKIVLHPPSTEDCIKWLESEGQSNISEHYVRLYANAPLTILEAKGKGDGFNFVSFIETLIKLQNQQVLSSETAQSWQENAEQSVKWLDFVVSEQLKQQVDNEKLWAFRNSLIKASNHLTNAGINKVVLLSGLLEQVNSLKSIKLEDYKLVG